MKTHDQETKCCCCTVAGIFFSSVYLWSLEGMTTRSGVRLTCVIGPFSCTAHQCFATAQTSFGVRVLMYLPCKTVCFSTVSDKLNRWHCKMYFPKKEGWRSESEGLATIWIWLRTLIPSFQVARGCGLSYVQDFVKPNIQLADNKGDWATT